MGAYVLSPDEKDPRRIVVAINQYAQGRSNAGGPAKGIFTCQTNAATTTVANANVGTDSRIAVCPATGAASTELGSGNFFIATATIKAGSFVVTHTNSATANRTFSYVLQG